MLLNLSVPATSLYRGKTEARETQEETVSCSGSHKRSVAESGLEARSLPLALFSITRPELGAGPGWQLVGQVEGCSEVNIDKPVLTL